MFTGIIEEVGTIQRIRKEVKSACFTIAGQKIFEDLRVGDSVAVNGVCLTVTSLGHREFSADAMNETISRSTLGELMAGCKVNMERAMPANGRFGGHIVSGHVDGTGKIIRQKRDGIAVWYTISANKKLLHYIIEKGSIAVDGISLTIAKKDETTFSVSMIPHTVANTTLYLKREGDHVNLENDMIAKYVEGLMETKSVLSKEFLTQHGF